MRKILASLLLALMLAGLDLSAARVDLLTSLISYWALDEASGQRNDAHAGNNLTDNNTVASAAGKISNAGDFELSVGVESLSRSDNADLSTGDIDFSLSVWVNAESFDGANPHLIAKINDDASVLEYQLFYHNATTRYRWIVFGAGPVAVGDVSANNFGAPGTGTWHHVVAWHDAANNLVGISVNDGTADTAATTGAPADTSANFTLGMISPGFGASGQWDGLIDEVGFWKKVLTSQERTDLYNSGNGLAYPLSAGSTTAAPALINSPIRCCVRGR